MNLNVKEFDLTFEAQGLKPLFQQISTEEYMPAESVLVYVNGLMSSYMSKYIQKVLYEKGKAIFSDKNLALFDDLNSSIEEAERLNQTLLNIDQLTSELIQESFAILRKVTKLYSYLDNAYIDGAYEIGVNVELIQKNKNVIRDKTNKIYFEKNGLWDTVLNKVSKSSGIPRQDFEWYLEKEIHAAFTGVPLSTEALEKRKYSYAFWKGTEGITHFIEGKESENFAKDFLQDQAVSTSVSEIKGVVANKGALVRAKVFNIVPDYSNIAGLGSMMDQMEQGSVLVAQTTAPELMPAIRKASAIITDIGGMLSHSAIVSRELGIPCIISTKNASKILKTGMMVEVDANSGIVRIL